MPKRRPATRLRIGLAIALFAGLPAVSCSSGDSGPTAPSITTGSVTVTAATSGPDAPASYTVALDEGTPRSIEANGSTSFSSVEGGGHTLTLGTVPDNCTVGGSNPRSATVTAGQGASVGFSITCVALTGSLEVTTVTSGDDLDPDGYDVEIDGTAGVPIDNDETLAPRVLAVGEHDIELTDVAANCALTGSNPRSVTVAPDETAATTFEVVCDASTGAIEVTATTTGEDIDVDGYTVELDGVTNRSLDTNGSTTFSGVSEGPHSLTLFGISANCSVNGDNPAASTVVIGETDEVAFELACTAVTGDLRVTANTTGSPIDPDGFTVTVDGAAAEPMGVNGDTITFASVAMGERSVLLGDIGSGCVVAGSNPVTETVPSGGEVLVVFDVSCTTDLGAIELTTVTTGIDTDSDGYTISLDGGAAQAIANEGVLLFEHLTAGGHSLQLGDIADNCSVVGNNPETPTVMANDTVDVTMTVDCVDAPNVAPTVTISSPDTTSTAAPLSVAPGDLVTFTGSAQDPEDGPLTGADLVWVSNVDGQLGTGESFATSSLSEGQHAVTLTATDSELAIATETVLVIVVPPSAPGYQITFRLAEGTAITPGQRTAIEDAITKMEGVVIGDVPDLPIAFNAGDCGPGMPVLDETVDDLLIYLSVVPIDGPNGVLGAAGPCWIRAGGFLPAVGFMFFDSADMSQLEAAGLVDEVLLHEAMHVMGFGTIWSALGLLQDPTTGAGGAEGNDTYFSGTEANARFDSIGGGSYTGGNVVPVENDYLTYGGGSLDSHWRESVFAHELMTPSIGPGFNNPLSVMTVGQFEDLGYLVDYAAADAYIQVFGLHAQGGGSIIHLGDDVWRGPLWVASLDGSARRIR